jgi:hypothetical protein
VVSSVLQRLTAKPQRVIAYRGLFFKNIAIQKCGRTIIVSSIKPNSRMEEFRQRPRPGAGEAILDLRDQIFRRQLTVFCQLPKRTKRLLLGLSGTRDRKNSKHKKRQKNDQ